MQQKDYTSQSHCLLREMTIRSYGASGKPVLVFPPQGGRFSDFEGFGMVEAIAPLIDAGKIRLFAVDSIDNYSWACNTAHPALRALRHEDYDRYIVTEVLPFIRNECRDQTVKCLATGCSMGGYHAANFFFRHPDLFDAMICLSGVLDLRIFIGDYMDSNVYFNSPLAYLKNLTDPAYLSRYGKSFIVVCTGQGAWEENMIRDARALKEITEEKGIPAWIDFWGYDVNHDWPWWKKQLPYFLERYFKWSSGA